MSNVLIVSAHPNQQSFNHALAAQANSLLTDNHWTVKQSDLYQMEFNALMGPNDINGDTEHGSLTAMQLEGLTAQRFSQDIELEQNKLRDADLIILQFPLWWGSYPAILKGWIERVCSYGFAYGSDKQLRGKKVLLSVTTGGAANRHEEQYYSDKLNMMANEVFGYMAMTVIPPLISHGPASANDEQRKGLLTQHKAYITELALSISADNREDFGLPV